MSLLTLLSNFSVIVTIVYLKREQVDDTNNFRPQRGISWTNYSCSQVMLNRLVIFFRNNSDSLFFCRSFLLVDGGQLYIYGYDGKLICSPKPPGLLKNLLNEDIVGLSPDTLVLCDKADPKSLLLFDANTGKPLSPAKFTHEV